MARTIDYWYNQLLTQKQNTTQLNSLNSTSKVANWNLWLYLVAVVIAALDNLFDLHKSGVDADLATLKPHSPQWYRTLALAFQYGQQTMPETDQYANTGLTADQIAAQKIIAQAAVTEVNGQLRMKVVKWVNNDYAQLTSDEFSAFTSFIQQQKDAGVNVVVTSAPPDGLQLLMDVWYDPLVLKGDGSRIDGTVATPVTDAITAYLQNLLYNGEYSNTALSDALQQVSGVKLVNIKSAMAQYGEFPFTSIDERYVPDGGYLRISAGALTINYRPYV